MSALGGHFLRKTLIQIFLMILVTCTRLSAQQQATLASSFVDSVGVNTHFSYTDSGYYLNTTNVIAALKKAHIRHIRDGLSYAWVAPKLYAIHSQVASAGIKADLVLPNPHVGGTTAPQLLALLSNYSDAEAVEAPNEYDLTHQANWASLLRAYLPTVWSVGMESGLPVYGPSLTQSASYSALGDVTNYMTYNNLHAYWGGRNPETWGWGGLDAQGHAYGSIVYDFDKLDIDGHGVPVVMTESGYVTSNTASPFVIPEAVEAIYIPRLLLHAWNSQIQRTYIYELMDEPSSTSGFGLLRADLTPRLAYLSLTNLLSLLADEQPGYLAPGRLSYTITGGGTAVESTLMQKQDGSFWLAIWLKGSVYNVNTMIATPLQPLTVKLVVGDGKQVSNSWLLGSSGTMTSAVVGSSSMNLSVRSEVTLLKIK
jgi:hypothetical protein